MNKQQFFYATDEFSITPAENSPGVISGYFMRWDVLSHDRGGFRVTFRKNSFANIGQDEPIDVKAHKDHNYDTYLGRTGNGSLKLMPDDIGVRFHITLPDTSDGRDAAVLAGANPAGRKDFGGMSFGFLPDKYKWKDEPQGPIQEHHSGRLVEVSFVFDPGFPFTSLQLHGLGDADEATVASLSQFLKQPKLKEAKMRLRLAEKMHLPA